MISSYYAITSCAKLTLHNSKYCHSEDLHDLEVLTNDYMAFSPSLIGYQSLEQKKASTT